MRIISIIFVSIFLFTGVIASFRMQDKLTLNISNSRAMEVKSTVNNVLVLNSNENDKSEKTSAASENIKNDDKTESTSEKDSNSSKDNTNEDTADASNSTSDENHDNTESRNTQGKSDRKQNSKAENNSDKNEAANNSDDDKSENTPAQNDKDDKNYFVGDLPYKSVDEVNFDTLININHRLDEKYVPENLVKAIDFIDSTAVKLNHKNLYADRTALLSFNEMMNQAEKDNVTGFFLRNTYRSFDSQTGLWKKRVREDSSYGREKYAPLGSAYPGSSEHQTGLAFDITSVSSPEASTAFMYTKQFKWLRDNSYKFGFILRYNRDKTNLTLIKFEPYHYRYVGKDLAKTLYEKNICLEEYYNSPVNWD